MRGPNLGSCGSPTFSKYSYVVTLPAQSGVHADYIIAYGIAAEHTGTEDRYARHALVEIVQRPQKPCLNLCV